MQATLHSLILVDVVMPQPWERVVQLQLGRRIGEPLTCSVYFELVGRSVRELCPLVAASWMCSSMPRAGQSQLGSRTLWQSSMCRTAPCKTLCACMLTGTAMSSWPMHPAASCCVPTRWGDACRACDSCRQAAHTNCLPWPQACNPAHLTPKRAGRLRSRRQHTRWGPNQGARLAWGVLSSAHFRHAEGCSAQGMPACAQGYMLRVQSSNPKVV